MTGLFKNLNASFPIKLENRRFNFAFFKNQRMTLIAIFVTTEEGKFLVKILEINEWEQRLAIRSARYINKIDKNAAVLIKGSLYIIDCHE